MYRAASTVASKACQAVRRASKVGPKFHTKASIDAQSSPSNMKQGTLANGSAFCSEKGSPAGLFLKNLKCGSNFTDGEQQDYDTLSKGETRIVNFLTKSVENLQSLSVKDLKCHRLASPDKNEKVGSKFHIRASIDAQSSPSNMKQGTLDNGSAFCSENCSPAGLFLKNLKRGSNFTDREQQDYDTLSKGETRIVNFLTKSVENLRSLSVKDLKCHRLASPDKNEKDGANGHVKLESLEGMRDDGYFIPPYFIGGQQENEHDLSRLCLTIGEEDSDDIPNKVTMSLDGKPADVARSYDLCMTQLKLYMCLMYASVDISEQVGYEKILAVATPRPASFYFSMKYLNKCITAVIDPFTGWLLAIITSNYAAQFRRSDFPYVRLANTVLMKAEGKYNELAPDGHLSIPIGIGHLREAVITLADFDGIETPESLFSMAVLVHHIMEPAKIHKAYSLVYKTLSEGTETTYSLSDPSIVQLTKNLGHVSSLAGRSLFDLFLGLPVRTIPPSKFKVEGISTFHDVFSEICLIPYSLIPKWYICSKTPPMFWCPISPGLGDPDIRPLENFPAALQTTDGERMLDLLRIELFFGDRTGGHPCAKAFEVVRRRPPGEDASYVWRLGPPIRGRPLCDAVSLKPAVDAVLRSKETRRK
ncbi:uncharacterized protein LOC127767829 isoform X2 [Oryza glaberrima]|uniref:uncharacterized protein LOC127767829 isoform X2 n=1 Tax=Oryza glaberrima TaxID=4538 RepID=UPI00224C5882|nr:uncharacterized protein LOC127767829 isoform X2 [Oryza glaberrima]